jgi:LysM repeat protein
MSSVSGPGGYRDVDSTDSTSSQDSNVCYAQDGDTQLSDIAQRFGCSTADLLQCNPQLGDANHLTPGQQIRLPQTLGQGLGASSSVDGRASGPPSGPVPASAGKKFESDLEGALMRSFLSADSQTPAIGLNQGNRQTLGPTSPQTIDVTQDPAFKALPLDVQFRMIGNQKGDPLYSQRLQQVLQNPLYANLTQDQQTKLLNVFASTDARGRDALPTLMNREVPVGSGDPPPTVPALLSIDNTAKHTSLLDNLNKLATEDMNPAAAGRRGEILGRTIEETGDPIWHLDQGSVGECAPTSLQTHLLLNTPSEYARLIGGLSSKSQVAVLSDGSVLAAAKNDIVPNATVIPSGTNSPISDTRSVTERMFQGAIQQYAGRSAGGPQNFDCNTDQTGLGDQQVANVLHGLYNRPYSVEPPNGQGVGGAVGSNQGQRDAIYNKVNAQLSQGAGPVAAGMIWGGNNAAAGSHEIMVTKVDNGRVYFRNPWGSRDAQGAAYKDNQNIAGPPPRRVEDSQGGLESMSVADFKRYLDGAVLGPQVGGN